jgi:hypothetical protein
MFTPFSLVLFLLCLFLRVSRVRILARFTFIMYCVCAATLMMELSG